MDHLRISGTEPEKTFETVAASLKDVDSNFAQPLITCAKGSIDCRRGLLCCRYYIDNECTVLFNLKKTFFFA